MAFSPSVQGDDEIALNAMRDCIKDLKDWMIRDQLKLNDDKTEFLLIGTKQQLEKVNFSSITVGDALIEATSEVRNLGSWFDSHLNMSIHISKLCASAFCHLYNIGRIRKFLRGFVTSRVDYCNSLLYGLPAIQINKMQRVLNAAARLVSRAPRYCHVTPFCASCTGYRSNSGLITRFCS